MAEVVIAGAGPAGAALGYLLAGRGVGVTLVERHTDFAREFRGEGLMPSGVDALAQMGLAHAVACLSQTTIETLVVYLGGRRLLRLALADLGIEGPRIVSQPALLETLVAEAARFPGFRLERGTTVRDLVLASGRVVGVRVESAAGAREVRADLVLGTDGRASVLRHRAGLHEVRTPQAFDLVWCKLPLPAWWSPRTTHAYLGGGHAALAFPSWDGRLQVGWIIQKGSFGELRRLGLEGWLGVMAAHVAPDFAAHLRAARTEATHPFLLDVVCDRLVRWTAPGLLLLGDAAHPMSPVGAQGINIALRDAVVAANRLVPALVPGAAPDVIDAAARQVQDERLPEVAAIQELQQAPPRVLFDASLAGRVILRAVLPLLVRLGLARRLFGTVVRRFAHGVADVRLAV
ncbi:MAG TPA: FAD-dependent monooxygenase [Candidatus Binatia bacterium]|nr:FAD-dependent monooxygenase [Candidatus Binatia bacterium]